MNLEKVKALFLLSGLDALEFHELANGYWPDCDSYSQLRRDSPWWLVKTRYGLIKIGWRKRVINIDWSGTPYRGHITKDDVTKTESSLHAWGYAKAVEYLVRLDLMQQRHAYAASQSAEEVAEVQAETGNG